VVNVVAARPGGSVLDGWFGWVLELVQTQSIIIIS
jgi:hypothetical protein